MSKKAEYTQSSAAADLEARQENGNESSLVLSTYADQEVQEDPNARDFKVKGNETDGFLGTDPVYVNYGIEQNKALRAEGGPEAVIEAVAYGDDDEDSDDEDSDDEKDEDEDEKSEDEDEKSEARSRPAAPAKKAAAKPDNK